MVCATEGAAAQAVQQLRKAALPKEKQGAHMRLLIIVNPCSGRGRSAAQLYTHLMVP